MITAFGEGFTSLKETIRLMVSFNETLLEKELARVE